MDSLLKVEQAFYTKDYTSVLQSNSNVDDERIRLLRFRALIATGKSSDVLAELGDANTPTLKAVKAYAMQSDTDLAELAQEQNDVCKHLVALTYAVLQNTTEALNVLNTCGNNLDCVLLKVHLLLNLNLISEAQTIVDSTRSWANDHIIFNLCEALVSLRTGLAQKAFFIYEENKSLTQSASSSLGMAASEVCLRRFPEASESIKGADLNDEATVTTSLALNVIQNSETEAQSCRDELKKTGFASSKYAVDLKEKEELFAQLVEKFNKV